MGEHSLWGFSQMQRRYRCPGSANIEQFLPDQRSEYSEQGTRLHHETARRIAGEDPEPLERDEENLVAQCVDKFRAVLEPEEVYSTHVEERVDLTDDLWGTADAYVHCWKDRVIGFDWKFGWLEPPDETDHLWQLGGYAEAAMRKHNARHATWLAFHPRADRSYSVTLQRGEMETHLLQAFEESNRLNAPLNPGSWCQYCRGVGVCDATVDGALTLIDAALPAKRKGRSLKEQMAREIRLLNGEKIASLLDKTTYLGSALDALRSVAKEILTKDPEALPGWSLAEESGRRYLPDITSTYAALSDILTQEEFLAVCHVKVSDLEAAVARRVSPENDTRGRRIFRDLVSNCVKRGKPIVKLKRESS